MDRLTAFAGIRTMRISNLIYNILPNIIHNIS